MIGGKWRGRKLGFVPIDGLRPTADRVRERLFNWLQGEVCGARCLDLFAGSGALGVEAVSRGAEHATLVDNNRRVVEKLKATTASLSAGQELSPFTCHCADARAFLNGCDGSFRVVWLDPPYRMPITPELLEAVDQHLEARSWVYLEYRSCGAAAAVPERWKLYRSGRAGAASYALYRIRADG